MKTPVRVVMSGAAGQIAYSAIFRLFSGQVLGDDQPVHLVMLEIPQAMKAAQGVIMEVEDCAFPCYGGVSVTSDPLVAFADADYAILFGAFPRGPGMERKDLLEKNKGIFEAQGKAILQVGKPDLRILVVGNPANTNARILAQFATNLKPNHVTAMTRLDHNRLIGQIAQKMNVGPSEVKNCYILGNHSGTMVPVACCATVNGKKVIETIEKEWIQENLSVIRQRGTKIIEARGASSAASAGKAALDHIHDWHFGTKEIVSVALWSTKDNVYNVPEGLIFSFPCTCENGEWKVVKMEYCDCLKPEIQKTTDDLLEERKLALGI